MTKIFVRLSAFIISFVVSVSCFLEEKLRFGHSYIMYNVNFKFSSHDNRIIHSNCVCVRLSTVSSRQFKSNKTSNLKSYSNLNAFHFSTITNTESFDCICFYDRIQVYEISNLRELR